MTESSSSTRPFLEVHHRASTWDAPRLMRLGTGLGSTTLSRMGAKDRVTMSPIPPLRLPPLLAVLLVAIPAPARASTVRQFFFFWNPSLTLSIRSHSQLHGLLRRLVHEQLHPWSDRPSQVPDFHLPRNSLVNHLSAHTIPPQDLMHHGSNVQRPIPRFCLSHL